ncbi:gamma-glutamyl peptidase 3-like [Cornus florida]|uniref:gamma-glutamyl peptidase 3-like n=1 Tax=Cornus florida TaxID=4283 RepID=UPI00289F3A14|nr:gamma-glutamyl peptidase 3-like [Cornus florida]
MKVEGEEKRYGLLLAKKEDEYVKEMYGGYFNVFVTAFGDDGERWDLFRVVEGQFPDTNDLQNYDGFVISGSPFDAYGNQDWILNLCSLLQTLDLMNKKVLGICFGHQVLCRALGGKVRKSCTGWDIGIRKVKIMKDKSPCISFLDGLDENLSALSIIECHQDEVWQLPVRAEVIACSDKTNGEMFIIGDHILGIQGHPECNKDILNNIIALFLINGSIEKDFAEEVKSKLEIVEPDRKCWERICKSFLKG